jgi:translation elongation factor EF-1beta
VKIHGETVELVKDNDGEVTDRYIEQLRQVEGVKKVDLK